MNQPSNPGSFKEQRPFPKSVKIKRSLTNMVPNQNYVIRYPTPTRSFQNPIDQKPKQPSEESRAISLANNSSASHLTTSYNDNLEATSDDLVCLNMQRSLTEITLNSYRLPETSRNKKKRSCTPATGMLSQASNPKMK